ncbi:MAG: hypothetical protein U0667_01260 [Chloroflexota bacterium]
MFLSFGSARRLLALPVLLVSLVVAGVAPAAAYTPPNDQYHGQYAHYNFVDYDGSSHDGRIDCSYRKLPSGSRRLSSFTIRPPRAWWYDTTSDTTHEHGTVGWRFRIQQTTDPDDDPWTTVYSSTVQKKTAYEDHPGYSSGDMAPFTTRSRSFASSATVYLRIKVTIYWYTPGGSVKGYVDHWYNLYDASYGGSPAIGYCRNKIAMV